MSRAQQAAAYILKFAKTLRDSGNDFAAAGLEQAVDDLQAPPCIKHVRALQRIARWHGEFPPSGRHFPATTNGELTEMSYGAAFGSNGERDYMRQVALDALREGQ